jgi:hypothetical protein
MITLKQCCLAVSFVYSAPALGKHFDAVLAPASNSALYYVANQIFYNEQILIFVSGAIFSSDFFMLGIVVKRGCGRLETVTN